MKKFELPEYEVVRFDCDDVIVTSICALDFECAEDMPDPECGYVCAGVCVYNACKHNQL